MTAIVHRIETPSTRDVWAAEGDGQTAHLVLAAQRPARERKERSNA